MTFIEVCPISPLAPYIGGKRQLSRHLVRRFARVPHEVYAEPFVGMGGVFFRRSQRPRAEVINDRSRDVATFFRVLQRHYEAFLDMLRWRLASRADFERLMATDPDTLTDLERAARFLQLQRLTFGGRVIGRSFGISKHRPGRFDIGKLRPMLEAAHDRLSGVLIECLDYAAFIERYDGPETLFYLDPPYIGSEHFYGAGLFDPAAFVALCGQLQDIRGTFVVTVNDVREARERFAWAAFESLPVSYSVNAGNGVAARELIVMNRPELLEKREN
jgi:DNA adenine methylase